MKLFYAPASPYAYKVRLAVAAKSLTDQVELVLCNPFENGELIAQHNPLGKVPALVLDDGSVLYDSPVICEYLDSLSAENQLIPMAGDARWHVLRWQALADGIMDQAYNCVMERRRPEAQQSEEWCMRWQSSIKRALDEAQQQVHTLAEQMNLSHLALVAALAYLDLRMDALAWRTERQALTRWYDDMRPHMTAAGGSYP